MDGEVDVYRLLVRGVMCDRANLLVFRRSLPLARLGEDELTSPQAMEGLRWDAIPEISYKARSAC
jgi:hypothetical protein